MTDLERARFQYLLDELCSWIVLNCEGDPYQVLRALNTRDALEELIDRVAPITTRPSASEPVDEQTRAWEIETNTPPRDQGA
jgi:hypothetical protein